MKAEVELYAHRSSPLHAWDARHKLVALGCLAVVLAMLNSLTAAALGLASALAFLLMARLPAKLILGRLAAAQVILLPCLLILPLTFGGERMTLGGIAVSAEGLRVAALFYLRALSVMTLGIAVIYSTPMVALLRAAQALLLPRIIVEIALLAYRYLFTLASEWTRVRWALAARGFAVQGRKRTCRPLANVIAMSLVRSAERTERIQQAMCCRGFQGTIRTLQTFDAGPTDWIKAAACAAVALVLWALDRGIPPG
jgi:cobalt/nickel transport system permease protein